jgi:hypothetical protein
MLWSYGSYLKTSKLEGAMGKEDPWYDKKPYKEGWPKGVTPLTIGSDEVIGFDRDRRIYLDGKLPLYSSSLALTPWQTVFAGVVAAATVIIAALDVIRYLAGK